MNNFAMVTYSMLRLLRYVGPLCLAAALLEIVASFLYVDHLGLSSIMANLWSNGPELETGGGRKETLLRWKDGGYAVKAAVVAKENDFVIDPKSVWPATDRIDDRILSQLEVLGEYAKARKPFSTKVILRVGTFNFNHLHWRDGQKHLVEEKCPITECWFTSNQSLFRSADAVVISEFGWKDMGRLTPKPANQVWVALYLEPPHQRPLVPRALGGLINWTMSYRHDSTIATPYAKWIPLPKSDRSQKYAKSPRICLNCSESCRNCSSNQSRNCFNMNCSHCVALNRTQGTEVACTDCKASCTNCSQAKRTNCSSLKCSHCFQLNCTDCSGADCASCSNLKCSYCFDLNCTNCSESDAKCSNCSNLTCSRCLKMNCRKCSHVNYTRPSIAQSDVSSNSAVNYAKWRTKKAAMFVSNCQDRNGRRRYAWELQKYIDVDIYGDCGGFLSCPRSETDRCLKMLKKDYKFFLAFENSNCVGYITEKLHRNALQNDVVPIVMGARAEDYAFAAPPGSYIHVEDFRSPRHLAEYLNQLDANDTLYNEYFRYKDHFRYSDILDTKYWCRLCGLLHLRDDVNYVTWYKDFEEWTRSACSRSRDGRRPWRTWKKGNTETSFSKDLVEILLTMVK